MAYLLLKYCGKSVKTYAGNLGHLMMSHRFFFKVVIGALRMSMAFLFFAFFLHEYSPTKSPPNPKDHYPRGLGAPNPEDYPPNLRVTPQP